MNTNQQNRLEIIRALKKEFPELLFEDLIHVARYIEYGRAELEPPKPVGPRKWAFLADIPETVELVEDRAGDVVRRIVNAGQTQWIYVSHRYLGFRLMDGAGPFTEVCYG